MLSSTAPTPTRCAAHTRLYREGRLVAEGFDVADVSEHLADPGSVVWLDLLQPDAADMAVLVEELGLHPLAIEDALHAHQRPKLDRYRDHLFLAAYAVSLDGPDVVTAEVAAFITPRALVTVRKDPSIDVAALVHRWDTSAELAASGVAFLVHGLLDLLVDGYVAVVQVLDDRSDAVEDEVFGEASTQDLQRRSFEIRSSVTALRRVVLPMREVVTTVRRRELGVVDGEMEPYLRDVDDHVRRVLDGIDSIREQLETVLSTTLAIQGQRLNETLFRLSAYAAILAVTTAITGFFGQNVPFPGSGEPSGFYASVTVLVVSVAALVVVFKRRGWL